MIDFLMISTRSPKRGLIEVYPKFIIKNPSSDLMIRGKDFYAVWLEDKGLWSTNEQDVLQLIDRELDKYAEKNQFDGNVKVMHMWDAESGMIDRWHKYCQKQMRDSFHMLDEKLIFSNTQTTKRDYASKKLEYPLEKGDIQAYDKLMSVLYSPEERQKIEWAIGSIVCGASKKLQKFMVLYGAAGTGKSTVLNIIQNLFEGYYSVFDAKSLGSSNNQFALEAFKSNPLVAIQHDGDLSKIEDNTRLNSLVSHELMTVNEKFKGTYSNKFKCFLFMGTNKPVKITDAKSGLIRRLIDVTPTGDKINSKEYKALVKQIEFELGAIAYHCKEVYESDPGMYDNYIPITMLGASNDFYNFIVDSYHVFISEEGISMNQAWEMYKTYCEQAKVAYPFSQRAFKEELKSYFKEYKERYKLEDGTRVRSYYIGFKADKFEPTEEPKEKAPKKWLIFNCTKSLFDEEFKDCKAQLANADEKPSLKWDNVKTTLKDIDTSKTHYILTPKTLVTVDFDIPDENGNKSFEKNLEAALKWPPTYAELSKSGAGIHLEYYYTGDISKLSRIYDEHIEIKVSIGNSSLRRKLTKCNNLPIATISSGLPMKGEKMVNFDAIKSEKGIRALIEKNLRKEIHPGTKPSIDFIFKILEDAYNSGLAYDVSDMHDAVLAFASRSTHQADYCIKLVTQMKFRSEKESDTKSSDRPIIFYDVEVFPNLFLINWKYQGEGKKVVRMINPTPQEVEKLFNYRLIGFNCRRYDNHILYARYMGYTNEQLYKLSQRIINSTSSGKSPLFTEAYNISYTDVYDFSAKKQSLKKWEIELGIHHQELGLPWDQPVPEELWSKVAEYCDNDVIATEKVFDHLKGDFIARKILSILAKKTVNDSTNSLTTKIIFGNERNPQDSFNYRFMGEADPTIPTDYIGCDGTNALETMSLDLAHTKFQNKKPIFEGYIFQNGRSTYRDEEVGEGGYVYAEPGIYSDVALLDVASMHPSSIEDEELFGPYTKNFSAIKTIRVHVKHGDFGKAKKVLYSLLEALYGSNEANLILEELSEYLTEEYIDSLSYALKIAINAVYGLTSASFANAFKDPRNKDNIVAKRGALFMINLKHEVQRRGFTVAHIKTDSIKIPNATKDIIKFVMDYGKLYGYTFEHEATYDRMCLVNDAVYIAKYKDGKHAGEWTATGTQFQVPYVFKTLFSKEKIEFSDMCETKSVSSSLYLDMNEDLPDVSELEKELSKYESKYKKGELSDVMFNKVASPLIFEIEKGHNYTFIGKVGNFCPIKKGCGGGVLYREKDGKYYAATGSKGYRWLESETVRTLKKEKDIDESYYISLVDDAVATISQYGDFEQFVSESPLNISTKKDLEAIPFE